MKFISQFSSWSAAIAFAFAVATISVIQADPTDDFSFSLSHAPEVEAYQLMSEHKVAEVLADHLDLFPISQTPNLAHHLLSLCRTYRFDPAFVLSLIQVESRFHVKVVSPAGAVGLMQLMPATALRVAADWKIPHPPLTAMTRALQDPFMNLTMGVTYLAFLRDRYQQLSPYYLLAAYNIGPAKMDELLSHKSFKPVKTLKYFEAIRRGVPSFRYYRKLEGQWSKARRKVKFKPNAQSVTGPFEEISKLPVRMRFADTI